MKHYLDRLPKELFALIRLASDIAAKNNICAYLVGGFVRDLILGVKNLDLDIVVERDGIKFAEDFTRKLNLISFCKKWQKIRFIRHKRFGTATIILKNNLKIDVATARKETYPQPASLPVVSEGNLEDDLARRDFTINCLAISIGRKDFGRLIDLFGARGDLAAKIIRILHSLSFIDDPTRMLRAIRFEKRYSFKIETETLRCLREAAQRRMLEKVEPQRLRDELILMFKEERPIKQLKRLEELAGFDFICPHLSLSQVTYRLIQSAENQINWFRRTHCQRRYIDTWPIYFMALTDPLRLKEVEDSCNKFVLRKGEQKIILSYKKIGSETIRPLSQDKIKPSKVFNLLEPLSYETIIALKAKYKNRNIQRHIEDFFKTHNDIRILISGQDLRSLNLKPGPLYQKIFSRVLGAKLNGIVSTKEEELKLVRKIIKNK